MVQNESDVSGRRKAAGKHAKGRTCTGLDGLLSYSVWDRPHSHVCVSSHGLRVPPTMERLYEVVVGLVAI